MKSLDPKNPNSDIDYGADWWAWLGDDTIATSLWTIPDGITKDSDSFTDKSTTIWLSGGTEGQSYELINYITTAAGRSTDQTITIHVKQK